MALAAIKEKLTQNQITSEYEVHSTQIKRWRDQALEAITDCFSKKREREKVDQTELIENLYSEIGRVQTQLNWLKKNVPLTIKEKRAMINLSKNCKISVRQQLQALGLNASTFYYHSVEVDEETEHLMRLLDEHYTNHPRRFHEQRLF